ncbi:MAG: 30S ribosomal protein S20 [Candidatus Riflebacteria bacterium]|nr:30S ribosomal protein S20 [Candidatus Riflebacteria bacterium]
MANTVSAAKNARKANARHTRRVAVKSELKTLRRKVLQMVQDKEPVAEVQTMLRSACKKLATAASNGYIHKRTASRKIGRSMKAVHKLTLQTKTA